MGILSSMHAPNSFFFCVVANNIFVEMIAYIVRVCYSCTQTFAKSPASRFFFANPYRLSIYIERVVKYWNDARSSKRSKHLNPSCKGAAFPSLQNSRVSPSRALFFFFGTSEIVNISHIHLHWKCIGKQHIVIS